MQASRASTKAKCTPARLNNGNNCVIISLEKSQANQLSNKKPIVKVQPVKAIASWKSIESNKRFVSKVKLISMDDAQNIAYILTIELEPENSFKLAKDVITGNISSYIASTHA